MNGCLGYNTVHFLTRMTLTLLKVREHELGDGLFVFITVLASRDIVPLFQKRQLMLVPKKEVSQFALELIRFNAIAVGKDDRRKFEVRQLESSIIRRI